MQAHPCQSDRNGIYTRPFKVKGRETIKVAFSSVSASKGGCTAAAAAVATGGRERKKTVRLTLFREAAQFFRLCVCDSFFSLPSLRSVAGGKQTLFVPWARYYFIVLDKRCMESTRTKYVRGSRGGAIWRRRSIASLPKRERAEHSKRVFRQL
jgi:hypothetical protein